jgi:peptide chain release factor 2
VWEDPERAQTLAKERATLGRSLERLNKIQRGLDDVVELLELAVQEEDDAAIDAVADELRAIEASLDELEFERMFAGELDASNAFLEIQAGSGGTEAQDWAEMLLRMYLKWMEKHGFESEIVELSSGEVA